MQRARIREMEEEYQQALEGDLAYLKNLLAYTGLEELNGSAILDYQREDIVNGTSPNERWTIHDFLLSLGNLAPGFEQRIKDERGSKAYERMMWAYQHDDDYFDRYEDRVYDLPAGDYYITDPCYMRHGASLPWDESVWEAEDLSAWNIPTSFMRDTIVGDWVCSLIDRNTDEQIGVFGADAGMVVVAKKDEVLRVNPSFEQWAQDHDWCVAEIHDFEGTLIFQVDEREYEWRGEMYPAYDLTLVFDGYDTQTGNYARYWAGVNLAED